ncbi:MAG: glycerol-3-phosphate 1-O-acyltransferase PlsY [Bacteroidetes bacterium]|nr:glycerol-3-phosphate 1-O-acyltransferase PlsY [Bacteroidota bacterium]MBM3424481.1 glycerol-3-phosphate 1-O-acyltransferase PlsY [Bacteroidota bacterium]
MLMALLFLLAYLFGAIPSAVWLGKFFCGKDVREYGSRNSGATNTFRVLGKRLGFAVLFFDVTKGYLAVQLAHFLLPDQNNLAILEIAAGLVAVLGHIYSVFVAFKGGKGVATSLGVYLALDFQTILVSMLVFFIVFLASRYVSLASMIAATSIPFVSYYVFQHDEPVMVFFNLILCALVVFAHRQNIKRLWSGNEPKMNFSNPKV